MSPELAEQIRLATAGVRNTSIRSLASEYLEHTARRLSPNTMPARMVRLRRFCNFMQSAGVTDVYELNNTVVTIYFEQLPAGNKATSRNADRMVVKSFISWIEEYKEIKLNVRKSGVKPEKTPKRLPRYLPAQIIEQRVIHSMQVAYIDRLIVACAFKLGLRVSELSNLRLRDFESDEMHVVGKGDKERMVVIPGLVTQMVRTYTEIAPYTLGPDDYLFQTFWRGEWRQMPPKSLWSHVRTVFQRQCDAEVSPKWMRSSYAVDLLLKGCDIVTVQKSLGHTDLKITQIYAELADDAIKEQIHKYLG